MKRAVFLVAIWLALAHTGTAQVMPVSPQTVTVIDSGVQCSVARACASWDIGSAPTVTMQITGTFTGTLTFEARSFTSDVWFAVGVNNAATAAIVTTTTAIGQFSFANTGFTGFRVRATAAMTGGANISLTRGTAMSAMRDRSSVAGGAISGTTGTFSGAVTIAGQSTFADGTAAAPSIAFTSQPSTGWMLAAASFPALSVAGVIRHLWGSTEYRQGAANLLGWSSNADPSLAGADTILARGAAGALNLTNTAGAIGNRLKVDALPVASVCGGGSPAVVAGSTPFAGAVTVGTGGPLTCTITFGGTAFPSAPHCTGSVETITAANARAMGYSASTTVLTIVPSAAWADSSVVNWICVSAK